MSQQQVGQSWGGQGNQGQRYRDQWNAPGGFAPQHRFPQPGPQRPGYPRPGQQPYGQPPPFGHQPYGGGRPPQRRSPLKMLLGSLVLVTIVAMAGVVTVNLNSSGSDVAYQNDNYQVPPPDTDPPPLPYAQSQDEVAAYLQTNPFYDQSTPIPVRCDLKPINLTTASDSALKTHFSTLMGCLLRVWEPPISDAGWQIVRPTVTIYGESVNTKCGNSGVNAFYCAADQQVYYSNLLVQAIPAVTAANRGGDIVVAHEFGHALQARTGILITAHLATRNGSEADQLLASRRLEAQADCFSGMFIRAVSRSLGIQQSDVPSIENTFRAIGDDTLSGKANVEGDHGLARSRLYWGQEGLGHSTVSSCNTFVVPASQVR
ncbi:MAG: neutral zinc metallopeptidase [Propionibacteriaceae bacterium]